MKDNYNQYINDKVTYQKIATQLVKERQSVIIGWTDERYDHRDFLFTYEPVKYGSLQRGLNFCNLYVSIMGFSCMGFLIERNTDNTKYENYLREKLLLNDNNCDNKICELINGVIHEIDILEGFIID